MTDTRRDTLRVFGAVKVVVVARIRSQLLWDPGLVVYIEPVLSQIVLVAIIFP